MTTSTVRLLPESSRIFAQRSLANPSGLGTVIPFAQFDAAASAPLPGTRSFDDFVAELEADPEFAADVEASRRELSALLYPDDRESLASMRLATGLSQAQLALRVETSQSHIARLEAGRNNAGVDIIERVAHALGVDPVRVFNAVRRGLHAAASAQS